MTDFTNDPSLQRTKGWRASKGPQAANLSGLRATGHRLLLLEAPVEEVTSGGIVLARKTLDKEKIRQVVCTVIEIGHDAWSDKTTDFCDVGDKVIVGEYTGKLHESHLDGKTYRFLNDLDVISPVFGG